MVVVAGGALVVGRRASVVEAVVPASVELQLILKKVNYSEYKHDEMFYRTVASKRSVQQQLQLTRSRHNSKTVSARPVHPAEYPRGTSYVPS